jgi:hypothetical protein
MSDTGKQSPLGVNTLSSLVQNIGFNINPIMIDFTGSSTSASSATQLGKIVNDTCLRLLTYSFNAAQVTINATDLVATIVYTIRSIGTTDFILIGAATNTVGLSFTASGPGTGTGTVTVINQTTYNNLISIGANTIPALGNSPPSTFNWTGYPNWASNYTYTNEVTRWGYVRLFALQGYNEFNYNSGLSADSGAYKDFLSGFMSSYSFIESSNDAILAVKNSQEFLDGTYSNMNDLITGDITGVSVATTVFGQDLLASGKAINLQTIATFGLPSNLLSTLQKNNCITSSVSLALIASNITATELEQMLGNISAVTKEQERKIYGAFGIILGQDLKDVLVSLNCKTVGLESLADLLNPLKLFPNSYASLTVPVYNTVGGPANSKIYYPIYVNDGLNSQLDSPTTSSQLVNAGVPVTGRTLGSVVTGIGRGF